MEEYRPNSHRYRDEQKKKENLPEKKVEKVITGTAKAVRKSGVRKIMDIFVSEDIEAVKSYILKDVLIPAIKKAISDVITNGSDMILYGESGRRKSGPSSKVSYRSYYEDDGRRTNGSLRIRNDYNYNDISLDNRGEAEDVLSRMDELISTYGLVSVADFYDLVGFTGNYTDNNYGWTDIRNARVVAVKDGYVIKLPKALPLN